MRDSPAKNRLQRRVERLRDVRSQPASARQQIAAGAVAGLVAAGLIFVVITWVGLTGAAWYLASLAAVFAMTLGVALGVKTPSGGIISGILSGIWFLIYVAGMLIMVLAEFLVVVLTLSLFSCG